VGRALRHEGLRQGQYLAIALELSNSQAQAVTALKEGDGTVKYRQVLKQVS
jgi:hypothetical protein